MTRFFEKGTHPVNETTCNIYSYTGNLCKSDSANRTFWMQVIVIEEKRNLSKPNPFGTDKFVQFRQVFGLHRFKLQRHLVDGTVMSVWFRQVYGLLSVRFRQVSLYWQKFKIRQQYFSVVLHLAFPRKSDRWRWLACSPRMRSIMGSSSGLVKPKNWYLLFLAKHSALKSKSKDQLARNHEDVSD